jgi:hypothetical protein
LSVGREREKIANWARGNESSVRDWHLFPGVAIRFGAITHRRSDWHLLAHLSAHPFSKLETPILSSGKGVRQLFRPFQAAAENWDPVLSSFSATHLTVLLLQTSVIPLNSL